MPREITITKTLYRFSELSKSAKEKFMAEYEVDDFFAEPVTEDFIRILEILGFSGIKTQYSGFWSQGDGASFSAKYAYKAGCLKSLKEYAPQDKELHRIAYALVAYAKPRFFQVEDRIWFSGHYCHEYTMQSDDKTILECARRLARWYYAALQKEYEYQTSEEYIAEMAEANEWEFDENGRLQ